jgi:hypothetical protein
MGGGQDVVPEVGASYEIAGSMQVDAESNTCEQDAQEDDESIDDLPDLVDIDQIIVGPGGPFTGEGYQYLNTDAALLSSGTSHLVNSAWIAPCQARKLVTLLQALSIFPPTVCTTRSGMEFCVRTWGLRTIMTAGEVGYSLGHEQSDRAVMLADGDIAADDLLRIHAWRLSSEGGDYVEDTDGSLEGGQIAQGQEAESYDWLDLPGDLTEATESGSSNASQLRESLPAWFEVIEGIMNARCAGEARAWMETMDETPEEVN